MTSDPVEQHMLIPKFKAECIDVINLFIKEKLDETGANGVTIGLSGGLDSAVVTKLCIDALGADKVLVLILPDEDTLKADVKDAIDFAESMGVEHLTIDISEPTEAFRKLAIVKEENKVAQGNIKARCRMIVLYAHANLTNRIVMGTGNKSELLTGYFTKFGDGGADFLPIGDLYKTQVIELAHHINIPEKIIKKIPSAGLWKDQTDEGELGIKYEALDKILLGIELKLSTESIIKKSEQTKEKVLEIQKLVKKSVHKRKMPLVPKIGIRTIGLDWRE